MIISKKTLWIVSACGVGALLLFFFFDLPIAQAAYHPGTWFGAFFRVAAPMMPSLCALLFLGCIVREQRQPMRWRVFSLVAAIFFSGVGTYMFFHNLHWSHPVAIAAVAAALFAGALLLGGWLHPDLDAVRRAAATAVVMIAVVFIAVELLKNIWGRPRFYAMTDPVTEFTRWIFPQGKPTSNAFKSFPSGHTANGSDVLLLLLLPMVFPSAQKHKIGLTVFAYVWIVLTAVSRMVEGMHFASDVTVGFLLAFWTFCAVSRIFFRHNLPGAKNHNT